MLTPQEAVDQIRKALEDGSPDNPDDTLDQIESILYEESQS